MRQPDFAANMPPSWKGPSQDSFSRGTPPQGESPNGTYNQGASRMLPDPRGYYARLGVEPFAAAETITATKATMAAPMPMRAGQVRRGARGWNSPEGVMSIMLVAR